MDGGTLAQASSLYVIFPLLAAFFFITLFLRYRQITHHSLLLTEKIFLGLLLVLYLLAYINLTFFANRRVSKTPQIEWWLFWSYKDAFLWKDDRITILRLGLARQILLNILVYMPVGLLMPLVYKKHPYISTLMTGFILSLLTEVMQYITHRGLCELDDLLNNTLGCLIGMTLFALGSKAIWNLQMKRESSG